MLYNKFSEELKRKYGEKVYKLPIQLPVTCPNRDGRLSNGGCIFCGEEGAGFEMLSDKFSVGEQIRQNSLYIGENYRSRKFIAYFQNFSNTYLPVKAFESYILDACTESIVAIYISTRPDCIQDEQLAFLREVKVARNVDIVIELGLQTVNYHTLRKINRGHSLAEFIDAANRIHRYGLETCVHYIVDFPMDLLDDVIEGAKIISALRVHQVKCHSLFILKETVLGNLYQSGEIVPVSLEEYIERIITFLEHLDPRIVIQRLIGRAPEDRSLFCNWKTSWWKIRDSIEEKMLAEGRFQGSKFNYLNGIKCRVE